MTDFTQMHIFFAVTTASVILVAVFTCAMLVAVTRLFLTLDDIATSVEEETDEIRADLDELRGNVRKGFRFVPLFHFFGKAALRSAKRKRARTKARKS
jgi:hypothetical protein